MRPFPMHLARGLGLETEILPSWSLSTGLGCFRDRSIINIYQQCNAELWMLVQPYACVKLWTVGPTRTVSTHTYPFNGPFFRDYPGEPVPKRKTNLDFTEARDSEWQWYQLGHVQVCTSLQRDNHASNPPLSCFTGRLPFLPLNQQRQSTEAVSNN